MAFCQKCGNEIHDEAVICTGCGCPTGIKRNKQATAIKKRNYTSLIFTILAVIGLILNICYFRDRYISYTNSSYSNSLFLAVLAYFLSPSIFAWLSIGFSLHNVFNKKYDKVLDTISLCSSSFAVIANIVANLVFYSSI